MKYFNKNTLSYLLILFVSGLVIFWQFPRLPQKLAFDEIEFTRLAVSLKQGFTIYSAKATGHATPYFYLLFGAFKVFGVTPFALRLNAALFGLVNPLLLFLILRFYFSRRSALLGSLIFATMHWVFQFARFAFEGTYLLFWELLAVYNLLAFHKSKKTKNLVVLIISTILAFYSYLPGRIFFIVPLAFLIWQKTAWKTVALYLCTVLILAIPLMVASGAVENRVSSLTYLSQSIPISQKVGYFFENISKNLLMFNFRGDINGRHNYPGKPALNPLLGILFWVGLFLGFRQKSKYRLFFLWISLGFVATLFTLPAENPHFLRTYTTTAGVVFFITLALEKLFPKPKFLGYLLIGLIILSGVYEIRTYFKYQKKVFISAFESTQKDLIQFKDSR